MIQLWVFISLLGLFAGIMKLLEASWEPPGRQGRLLGATEAENSAKTAYLHVFYEVSGGPRNRSAGLRGANRNAFLAWGEPSGGGKEAS